jgi:hypothetical protein
MRTNETSAKDTAFSETRQAWKRPALRLCKAKDAATGIFLGPELITDLS